MSNRMRSQEQEDYHDMLAACQGILHQDAIDNEPENGEQCVDTEHMCKALILAMRAIGKVLANMMLD